MKYFIIIVIVVISNTFLGVAKPMKNQAEIYFAGGCFWGTEHFLKQIRGVESTQVGYANSSVANPSYEQVCSGKTNAAETVKVVYDPKTVDLNLLLDLYFKTIDPTSLNRQGNDRGTQYRTGIYYVDKEDLPVINQAIKLLSAQYKIPIAIEVKPLTNFYPAETYHQDYLDKNPGGYCHINPALFEIARKANAPKTKVYQKPDDSTLRKELSAEQYAVTRIELVGRNKQRLSGGNININAWAVLIPVFIVEGRFGGILLGYCILFRRQVRFGLRVA